MLNKKRIGQIECVVYYILLGVTILWFSLYIYKGIDVTDIAYYLTRYKYYFSTDINVKSFGTFLTDLTGAVVYQSFSSGQALVLSICHWGLYMGSGLIAYKTFRGKIPRILLVLAILGGSLFSLTWVHVMNYNATSMFVQTAAICVLIKGIEKDMCQCYVVSGALFGINVFFRLPNILQIGIGASILWFFIFCKKEMKKGVKRFILYIMGVIAGGVAGGCMALFVLGWDNIYAYLFRTAGSAASSQSSHGIKNILRALYYGGRHGIRNWFYYGMIMIIILVFHYVFFRRESLSSKLKKWSYIILNSFIVAYAVYVGQRLEYVDFFQMIGVCILGEMLIGTFYYQKKDAYISAICCATFCAEVVLCIGTNNAWEYQIVFLIFPLCSCAAAIWKCQNVLLKKYLVSIMIFTTVIFFSVGIKYATQYVYRDAPNSELRYSIEADEYKGILTSKERAKCLNELKAALDTLDETKLLSYGDCNIGYVISDMEPFLERVWIDLDGYSVESLRKDLGTSIEEKGYPVILIADMNQDGQYRSEEKLEIIKDVIKSGQYKKYYENEWYCIYSVNVI